MFTEITAFQKSWFKSAICQTQGQELQRCLTVLNYLYGAVKPVLALNYISHNEWQLYPQKTTEIPPLGAKVEVHRIQK